MGKGSAFRTLRLSAAEREAIGYEELAGVDALCRRHGVALETWLGGALRAWVSFARMVALAAVSGSKAMAGRVALLSSELDVETLLALLAAAADKLGPEVELALQLDAQLPPNALRALHVLRAA